MHLPEGTAMLRPGSPIERKNIVMQGLIQASAKSFFAPYKGNTADSVVYVVNDKSKTDGNTVAFDMRGCLEIAPIRGDNTAEGKGAQKQKFSDEVTIDTWRFVVDNGTKFRAKAVGDMKLAEHSDSVRLLADQWVRSSDQGMFDVAQQAAEFGFVFDGTQGKTFDLKALRKIDAAIKAGFGYDVHPAKIGRRTALKPFRTADGQGVYLFLMDTFLKNCFLNEKPVEDILAAADVRGNKNRLFSGNLGKLGNIVFVEAPIFSGVTSRSAVGAFGYNDYEATAVLEAGLRTYIKDTTNGTKVYWQGTAEYDKNISQLGAQKALYSRGIILGGGALQFAVGMDPDYHFRTYDFARFSESCLEVWCGLKPSRRNVENKDYMSQTVAGYNHGLVFVDVKIGGGA